MPGQTFNKNTGSMHPKFPNIINLLKHCFLNVLIPVVIGVGIYTISQSYIYLPFIRNYVPDGLWAFALVSCVLQIWEGDVNILWIAIIFCLFIGFEWLQELQIISGDGDWKDLVCYFLFGITAILINKPTLKKNVEHENMD